MPPRREDFEAELNRTFVQAEQQCRHTVDVRAGDLHIRVGGGHGQEGRMPTCCGVMTKAMGAGDEVVASPPRGKGAGLVIRYALPRELTATEQKGPIAERTSVPTARRKAKAALGVAAAPARHQIDAPVHADGGTDSVVLVSCVKRKGKIPAAAKDLYASPLFRGMRAFAEATRGAWFILSAEHGVLHPEQVIAPYERTLTRMRREQRDAWSERVRQDLSSRIPLGACVIILAGQRYREGIEPFLRARGHHVDVPMTGLTMGQQLRWLRDINARPHVR